MKKASITKLGFFDCFVGWELEHEPGFKRGSGYTLRVCHVQDGKSISMYESPYSKVSQAKLERQLQRTIEVYQDILNAVKEAGAE